MDCARGTRGPSSVIGWTGWEQLRISPARAKRLSGFSARQARRSNSYNKASAAGCSMIPANNPLIYHAALVALSQHRQSVGRGFKGRFIQIFLGMKFYQNFIPSMFSGSFVSTEVLQTLLDDLYAKAS